MISPVKLWRNQKKIRALLGSTGEVVSFTIIRVPPAGFEDQAPYTVVLVKMGHQTHIGQLVGCEPEEVVIGQKVVAVLRRVRKPEAEDVIAYGVKFMLVTRNK
ncbi:hypothetical protein C4579_01475 [Candidatus Microgenomates bacterium]|nr:MAG: hypothetical protein C4579_01475 [Candidatus Microgenomates bacterium]